MSSQESQILLHLLKGYTLTSLEALRLFGCLRLSSRIFSLRKQGWNISTEMVKKGGKEVAQYQLIREEKVAL